MTWWTPCTKRIWLLIEVAVLGRTSGEHGMAKLCANLSVLVYSSQQFNGQSNLRFLTTLPVARARHLRAWTSPVFIPQPVEVTHVRTRSLSNPLFPPGTSVRTHCNPHGFEFHAPPHNPTLVTSTCNPRRISEDGNPPPPLGWARLSSWQRTTSSVRCTNLLIFS